MIYFLWKKKKAEERTLRQKVRGILAWFDRESPSQSFSFSVYITSLFFFMCLIATGRRLEIFYRACQQIFISPFNYHTTCWLLLQDVVRGRALQIRWVIEHLSIPKAFGVPSGKLNSKNTDISNINALLLTPELSPISQYFVFLQWSPWRQMSAWGSEFPLEIEETSSFWLLKPMEKNATFLIA